mmetsp:Transcript_2315/g.3313  ORF Transcript_2315/g.3313 Transcript_2315/m.3313 type:complete len:437 (-) Transcript_2315:162-1472(-)|eukprot:CAMPEP_0184488636 /NCGR_PEP_ID=MMETSP0113_2-20130426/12871_1 /TAXON_ID=91329 /ORGANISM="Norrisiella sphaerica, Strain BC52" /LENGTH=436 /DNA_ID=CAMNT_0026871561 /DNA_START=156 /DNA_END=1466 /DNA_ORIENTATION=-
MGKRNRARKRKAEKSKQNRQQYRPKREKRLYSPTVEPTLNQARGKDAGKILILGDGDFSFSRGLIRSRPERDGSSIIATSYDSGDNVRRKYPNSTDIISEIKKSRASVLHDIDCRKLHTGKLASSTFSRIIFNFPHSGQQRVHVNKCLLRDFFLSAERVIHPDGEVHVTLRDKPPYSNWKIEEQAAKAGFRIHATRMFDEKQFPGYRHRTTLADAETFDSRFCRTRIFKKTSAGKKKRPESPDKDSEGCVRDLGTKSRTNSMGSGIERGCHRSPVDQKSRKKLKRDVSDSFEDMELEPKRPCQRKGTRCNKPKLEADDDVGSRSDAEGDGNESNASSDAIFDVFGLEPVKILGVTDSPSVTSSPVPVWLRDNSLGNGSSHDAKKVVASRTKSRDKALDERKRNIRKRKLAEHPEKIEPCSPPTLARDLKKLKFGKF